MHQFDSTRGCHPETYKVVSPLFRAKAALAAPQQEALDLATNRDAEKFLFLIAQCVIVSLTAPDEIETQRGYQAIISRCLSFAHSLNPESVAASMHALGLIFEQSSKDPGLHQALVNVVVRGHDFSLRTGKPELRKTQNLPFMPKTNGAYLDLASGPLASSYIGEQFKLSGNTCVFLDNSTMVVEIAREYAKRVELSDKITTICADVCDAPTLFLPQSFDVVHFRQPCSCFAHRDRPLSDLDVPGLLELVKPGGYFVLGYTLMGESPGPVRVSCPEELIAFVDDELLDKVFSMLETDPSWTYDYGSWVPMGRFARGVVGFTTSDMQAPEAVFAIQKR